MNGTVHRCHGGGFTITELLTVIAIIGLLMGLLLPSVQAARESGRRLQCANNLRQVAIALQHYHSANQSLPAGVANLNPQFSPTGHNDNSAVSGLADTWNAMILPQLGHQPLFDGFDFRQKANAPQNRDLVATPLPALACPSDAQSSQPVLVNRCSMYCGTTKMMGQWYCGSLGPVVWWNVVGGDNCPFCPVMAKSTTNPCCNQSRNPAANWLLGQYATGPGMFHVGSGRVVFADVLDGLSNTVLLGEFLPAETMHNGMFMSNWSTVGTNIPLNTFATPIEMPPPVPDHSSFDVRAADKRLSGIKSRHVAGAFVAFSDGSTRFLDERIELNVLNAIGSRKLGTILGEPMNAP